MKMGQCLCSIKGILDVVSKKWTICIVSILDQDKPLRFNEIKETINTISPKALSDILKILEKEGIITRTLFSEIPPRVEYSLTIKGRELKKALTPLVEWASQQSS
jgi:DNA-binding HxlR family transcriptional regulator